MDHEHSGPPPFWRSPAALTLLVAAAVGGFLLLTEHRAHVLRVLPYAFLLACPLMHMFMHRQALKVTSSTTTRITAPRQCRARRWPLERTMVMSTIRGGTSCQTVR